MSGTLTGAAETFRCGRHSTGKGQGSSASQTQGSLFWVQLVLRTNGEEEVTSVRPHRGVEDDDRACDSSGGWTEGEVRGELEEQSLTPRRVTQGIAAEGKRGANARRAGVVILGDRGGDAYFRRQCKGGERGGLVRPLIRLSLSEKPVALLRRRRLRAGLTTAAPGESAGGWPGGRLKGEGEGALTEPS